MAANQISKRLATMMLVTVSVSVFAEPAHAAFQCPYDIAATAPIKKEEIEKLLPPGDAMDDPDRLNASIDAFRKAGISQIRIVDHLIGAYCPTVAAERDVSDVEKTGKVRRYASRIAALVYRTENEIAIILDVPLKPETVDTVDARAKSSGLTTQEWLSRAIEKAVAQ